MSAEWFSAINALDELVDPNQPEFHTYSVGISFTNHDAKIAVTTETHHVSVSTNIELVPAELRVPVDFAYALLTQPDVGKIQAQLKSGNIMARGDLTRMLRLFSELADLEPGRAFSKRVRELTQPANI